MSILRYTCFISLSRAGNCDVYDDDADDDDDDDDADIDRSSVSKFIKGFLLEI